MSDEWQSEQARVGQQAIDDLAVAHRQIAQTCVAVGPRSLVEQGTRPKSLHEPAQLGGCDPALAQIHGMDCDATFTKEPMGRPGVARVVESEDLDIGHPLGRLGREWGRHRGSVTCAGDAMSPGSRPRPGTIRLHISGGTRVTVWFTLQLDDAPGSLARVATALAERGVNITGIVGVAEDTDGALMLTTSDPTRTREAFSALDLVFEEHDPTGGLEPESMTVGDLRPGAAGRGSLG